MLRIIYSVSDYRTIGDILLPCVLSFDIINHYLGQCSGMQNKSYSSYLQFKISCNYPLIDVYNELSMIKLDDVNFFLVNYVFPFNFI